MHNKFRNIGLIFIGVIAGVLISLNFQAVADRAARTVVPIEELRAFTEVFGAIKTNYVEPVEDKKLITEAINGMLTGLDPHSAYLDQEAFKELQVGTQGQFGGLGIEVGMEDGFVKVISPIEDTPAFKAGIKPGDLIIKLDEMPVKGMTLTDAVKKMRGKPNTQITLTISRNGETVPVVVTLTRAIIRVQSVKSKTIEPGYVWVRVSQFQEATAENLVKQLDALFRAGQVKGLVLDLRNDPGGLLHGAVAVSSAFLPAKSLIVSTDGRAEDAKKKFFATPDDYVRGSVVEDPSDTATATRVREADLQRHLENGKAKIEKAEPSAPRAKPAAPGSNVAPGEQKPPEFGGKDDFQLLQALAYLKGEPVKGQSPTVAQTKPSSN